MGTQGTGRKRNPNKEKLTAEDDALNLIAREAEARLAAKRAARAEAREIRMKELERQQKEISDDDERMSVGSRSSVRVDERLDRDYLEKGTRSLGGTSSRRGSGDTSITADTETSIREIKEIHELKDQIQDVETKYMQSLKEVKDTLVEVEEKYRKAMVSNAQLDNEKNNLMYQVDTLKDSLMELEEQLCETRREHDDKFKELEREKHAHSILQFQFNEAKETLKQSEELLTKHGIVLGPDLNANGETGETANEESASAESSSRLAQDSEAPPTEGNSMLGPARDIRLGGRSKKVVGEKEGSDQPEAEARENHLSSHTRSSGANVSEVGTHSEHQSCVPRTQAEVVDMGNNYTQNSDGTLRDIPVVLSPPSVKVTRGLGGDGGSLDRNQQRGSECVDGSFEDKAVKNVCSDECVRNENTHVKETGMKEKRKDKKRNKGKELKVMKSKDACPQAEGKNIIKCAEQKIQPEHSDGSGMTTAKSNQGNVSLGERQETEVIRASGISVSVGLDTIEVESASSLGPLEEESSKIMPSEDKMNVNVCTLETEEPERWRTIGFQATEVAEARPESEPENLEQAEEASSKTNADELASQGTSGKKKKKKRKGKHRKEDAEGGEKQECDTLIGANSTDEGAATVSLENVTGEPTVNIVEGLVDPSKEPPTSLTINHVVTVIKKIEDEPKPNLGIDTSSSEISVVCPVTVLTIDTTETILTTDIDDLFESLIKTDNVMDNSGSTDKTCNPKDDPIKVVTGIDDSKSISKTDDCVDGCESLVNTEDMADPEDLVGPTDSSLGIVCNQEGTEDVEVESELSFAHHQALPFSEGQVKDTHGAEMLIAGLATFVDPEDASDRKDLVIHKDIVGINVPQAVDEGWLGMHEGSQEEPKNSQDTTAARPNTDAVECRNASADTEIRKWTAADQLDPNVTLPKHLAEDTPTTSNSTPEAVGTKETIPAEGFVPMVVDTSEPQKSNLLHEDEEKVCCVELYARESETGARDPQITEMKSDHKAEEHLPGFLEEKEADPRTDEQQAEDGPAALEEEDEADDDEEEGGESFDFDELDLESSGDPVTRSPLNDVGLDVSVMVTTQSEENVNCDSNRHDGNLVHTDAAENRDTQTFPEVHPQETLSNKDEEGSSGGYRVPGQGEKEMGQEADCFVEEGWNVTADSNASAQNGPEPLEEAEEAIASEASEVSQPADRGGQYPEEEAVGSSEVASRRHSKSGKKKGKGKGKEDCRMT